MVDVIEETFNVHVDDKIMIIRILVCLCYCLMTISCWPVSK